MPGIPHRQQVARIHARADDFELDAQGFRLLRDGEEVPLERRSFDLLCYLVENPGRVISKSELLERVWHARVLGDGAIANSVAKLRKALNDETRAPMWIETVYGRGYRWRAEQGFRRCTTPTTGPGEDPFVGRHAALEKLSDLLERTRAGRAQCVLISGETGIGKTRTAAEFAIRARERGFSVWEGVAWDGAGAPAYWIWAEVVRAAQQNLTPDEWRRHVPERARALAPELFEDAAAPPPSAACAPRFELFDELTRFLRSVSRDQPRLIVLDDVHWAGVPSLELLVHLARALRGQSIMFVAMLREQADDPATAETLQRLERRAVRIRLRGLTPVDVAQLMAALDPNHSPTPEAAAVLAERTAGNPRLVRQFVEYLTDGRQSFDGSMIANLTMLPAMNSF